MSNRIDLTQLEELMESIVICEEEYIKGSDNLLEDCQTLKDRMQIILAELKRCYEEIDEVTKWKDHWKRTSQTWSKVVEIFDPKANNAELNDAINKAFGHDASE